MTGDAGLKPEPAAPGVSPAPPVPGVSPAPASAPVPPGPDPSAPPLPGAGSAPPPGGDARWGGWLSTGASAREMRRAERHARREARRGERGIGGPIWGVLLVLIGAGLLASELIPGFDWDVAWPAVLVGFGILLVLASIRRTPTDA